MPEKNWWSCSYAVGVTHNWYIPSEMIVEGEIYDSYGCENKKILEKSVYPQKTVESLKGCGGLFSGKEISVLGSIEGADKYLTEFEKLWLKTKAAMKIEPCKHCEFYKPKELLNLKPPNL